MSLNDAPWTLPWPQLLGGVLIGLGGAVLWLFNGRTMGISGIAGAAAWPSAEDAKGDRAWRLAFVGALVLVGFFAASWLPESVPASPRGWIALASSGLLVGVGTRLGGGCTSGHGVCGVGRGSVRSVVATATFVGCGVLTATALHWLGGAS